jgi:hypothetical protein
VLRAVDHNSAAQLRNAGIPRGFWGEIFPDFFAGWWRNLINGAQRAVKG